MKDNDIKRIDGWTITQSGPLLECVSSFKSTYINLLKVREFESFKSDSFTRIEFRIIKRDGTHGCVGIRLHTEYADDFIDDVKARIESLGFITEE